MLLQWKKLLFYEKKKKIKDKLSEKREREKLRMKKKSNQSCESRAETFTVGNKHQGFCAKDKTHFCWYERKSHCWGVETVRWEKQRDERRWSREGETRQRAEFTKMFPHFQLKSCVTQQLVVCRGEKIRGEKSWKRVNIEGHILENTFNTRKDKSKEC